MAAHHGAQRPQYSIPPPPPPPNVFNDELRLPSIKDLAFKYERPRQESSQSTGNTGLQGTSEYSVSSSQERTRGHPQSWGRSTHPVPPAQPPTIPIHHPQQQHTPPLSAGGHDAKSAEYPRHDSGGYLTPGIPLSAQMTPLPGTVSTGPAGPGVRTDDQMQQNKRPRPSSLTPIIASRDPRSSHTTYTQYQYQSAMPPPSPYHQMSPVSAAPPTPQTPLPPSPHPHMHHPHSAAPGPPATAHPGYSYQQTYVPRPNPQHVPSHPPHPSHTYHAAPPQHTHAQQQLQAPPPPPPPTSHSVVHHSVPYPSPSPSLPQEQWEQHHQQHPQPVQHQPVQHVLPPPPPPPAPVAMHPTQYSHPPPPMPPVSTQQPPQNQPQPQPHPNYAQPVHSQPPAPQHHSLARAVVTTPITPTPEVNVRTSYGSASAEKPVDRQATMSEIVELCSILYDFASRYSSLNSTLPHLQPSQTEVMEMARRANHVVRLLTDLRRMNGPVDEHLKSESSIVSNSDDHRPPKRPWEDMAQDGQASGDDTTGTFTEPISASGDVGQSTAEQDMEIIRSKRATTTAGAAAAAGQPKSKYRKRSRATPPGKCHSCNIRETPEWRRGPDGARTLCNACGLHYAKLMRKHSKMNPQNGEPAPPIDMETLKASTKAAEAEKSSKPDENIPPTSQHHQGSFQVAPVLSPTESSPSLSAADPSRLPAHHQTILPPPSNTVTMHPPPPPWAAVPRTYGTSAPSQTQSFLRNPPR